MNLFDLHTSPWAIHPEKLRSMLNIYNSYLKGPKLDFSGMEAVLNPLNSGTQDNGYEVMDGNALIDVKGVLTKNPNAFMRIFYNANSMMDIKDQISKAIENPAVKKIMLIVDSPGGTVDGTQELANFIFESRGKKEIIAFTDGMIASAAYWIASAADKIYISGDTVEIGSIGVITTHADYSKMNESFGIQVTEIYAGKYKTAGSPNKPLSGDDKEYIQSQIDYLYTVFVSDVARNRNVSIEDVLKNMADARIFIGAQAINAGLADGVSVLDRLLNNQPGGVPVNASHASAVGPVKWIKAENGEKNLKQEDNTVEMTVEILQKDFLAVFESVKKLGAAEADKTNQEELQKVKEASAKAETERILAVKAQLIPGHEALIEKLMFDGKTTGDQAAVQVIQAEKEKKSAALKNFRAEGPDPLQSTESEEETTTADSEKPIEEQAKAKWDNDSELRAEFQNNFESYLAYRIATKAGSARILGQKEGGK
jgi:signal peptide peptidase SppA